MMQDRNDTKTTETNKKKCCKAKETVYFRSDSLCVQYVCVRSRHWKEPKFPKNQNSGITHHLEETKGRNGSQVANEGVEEVILLTTNEND